RTAYQLNFQQPKPAESLVARSKSSLPVVISDGSDFFEMQHYASANWKQRFFYIADPVAATAHGRSDTSEKELMVLRDFAPLQVFGLEEFVSAMPKFLLFSDPKPENNPDWRISRLIDDGYSVKNLVTDGQNTVYLVESKRHE